MAVATDQIIFDFDGVILDSAIVKTRAFAEVYAGEDAAKIAAVVEYQEANGVGRAEKFRTFEQAVFGRPGHDDAVADLCRRFAAVVDVQMQQVAFIAGAQALLEECHGRVRPGDLKGDGRQRSPALAPPQEAALGDKNVVRLATPFPHQLCSGS